MYDIHAHILPGLDDGVDSLDETLKVINIYLENGYKGVITTTHYYENKFTPSKEEIKEQIEVVQSLLKGKNIDFEIYTGNELFLNENTLSKLENKEVFAMAGSRYVLIEFPFLGSLLGLESILYEIQLAGYIPIIAHVERYEMTKKNLPLFEDLIKKGSLLQINLSSLRDENSSSFKVADELLRRNMVHFVGTDTHGSLGRYPDVSRELAYLKARMGEEWYKKVVVENPKKILSNQYIDPGEIKYGKEEKKQEKKSFLDRLFKKR